MPDALADLDLEAFAREKLLPMVRGCFPASEQTAVLDMLGRSVIFLTADNIEAVLHTTPFAGTAWTLATLYLLSSVRSRFLTTRPRSSD